MTAGFFRLFNFGIGVHLLQAEDLESLPPQKTEINPKDNHISFTTVLYQYNHHHCRTSAHSSAHCYSEQ